jgi:hypothetical protein
MRVFESWDAVASALKVAINQREIDLNYLKTTIGSCPRRVRVPERHALVGKEVIEKLQLQAPSEDSAG